MRALSFLGMLMLTPIPAQQTASVAADGTVVFKTNSQLVVELVSVTDKNGKVIKGLTARDFSVTENGAAQTISFCEFQKLDEITDAPPGSGSLRRRIEPATPPIERTTQTQISPEPPGDIRYRNRRLLALYFDMTAMPPSDQLRALTAAQKFVRGQMMSADMAAIMTYTGGSVRVHLDFSDDRDLLLDVLQHLAVDGQSFDVSAGGDSAGDTGAAFGQDDSEFNIFNTDRQLAALQTAVQMLAHLNERKSLVYFASGLRLSGVDNQAQMSSTVNSAIRANVAFFPVDTRGLTAQAPLGDATQVSPGGLGMYNGASAGAVANNFQKSQDALYALAADTGGKALLDYNDLTKGIVQAQTAISSYYIIGYYTTAAALDGKFRRIAITLKDLSAKLDYRQGYFAGKTFRKFTGADKERQLEDALMLGDPVTDLAIAMEVDYFQLNRSEYYVPVVMKIPGSELVLARRAGAEHTVLDFIGEIKDEWNATVQNIRDRVEIKLTSETAAQLGTRSIEYDSGYTLLPGTYSIKVLARDDETGRIGTYISKFTIPNLAKDDERVAISSVILSSQRVDLKDSLYTAGKDKEQSANPLVQDGQKLVPSVTRVFSKSKEMYIYLQAYQLAAASFQPLVGFVTFYRGQVKAFETPPLLVVTGTNNRLKMAPFRFAFAVDKLPAGKYNCQVTVLDPAGNKAAFWQSPVMVAP
jgi:VWFA-related protein